MSVLHLIQSIWQTDDELRNCLAISPITIPTEHQMIDQDITYCLMQDFEDLPPPLAPIQQQRQHSKGKRMTPRKLPLGVMHYSRGERRTIGKAFKQLEREDELRLIKDRLDDSLQILTQIQGSLTTEMDTIKRIKEDLVSYIDDDDDQAEED
jgi:hypothetical protein